MKLVMVLFYFEIFGLTGLCCLVTCSGGLRRFKYGKGTARKKKKNIFVGRYRVLLRSFEKVALPALQIPPRPPRGSYMN